MFNKKGILYSNSGVSDEDGAADGYGAEPEMRWDMQMNPLDAQDIPDINATGLDITLLSNGTEEPPNHIHSLPDDEFAVPVNGFLMPIVVLLTVVTNLLVCVVLLKPNMRTATNTILVAMAISNTLTGVWPVPCNLYFYVGGLYRDYLPFRWCFPYYCLTDFIPTVFHTASIWLTVALGVQRYICVCRSAQAKEWCTIANAVRIAVTINLAALVSHGFHFFDYVYVPVSVESKSNPGQMVEACVQRVNPFFGSYVDVFFNIYYWFRVVFIHLVPCVVLVVVNALLVHTMRVAQRRRNQLLMQNRKSECRRIAEINGTTMMLVAVVGVFLIVEFPQSVLFIIMICENTILVDQHVLDPTATATASLFVNLFIMFSYSVNFFIYCGMSTQFRNTFKELFVQKRMAVDQQEERTRVSEVGIRLVDASQKSKP